MEFHKFLARCKLTAYSRAVLAVWGLFFFWGMLISVPTFDALETGVIESVLVVFAFGSVIAAVAIAIAATFAALKYLSGEERNAVLLRLWIIPLGAAVYYLATRASNPPSSEMTNK